MKFPKIGNLRAKLWTLLLGFTALLGVLNALLRGRRAALRLAQPQRSQESGKAARCSGLEMDTNFGEVNVHR